MKKAAAVLVVLGLVFGVWFLFSKGRNTAPEASPEKITAQDTAVAVALAKQDTNAVAIIQSNFARAQAARGKMDSTVKAAIAPSGAPLPLQITNVAPEIVLENVGRAIRQYGEMFGGNPVGNNQEIASQLNGGNPKGINFINAEAGMRINEQGEIVDAWGTPYFFHQISGTDMEIHSAGPDRVMWTSDDLVMK
jgi:hypothetical protein